MGEQSQADQTERIKKELQDSFVLSSIIHVALAKLAVQVSDTPRPARLILSLIADNQELIPYIKLDKLTKLVHKIVDVSFDFIGCIDFDAIPDASEAEILHILGSLTNIDLKRAVFHESVERAARPSK